MRFPNGLPHKFQIVTGTLSWLLAVTLSGFVNVALTVLSPVVDAVVGMVYTLQQQGAKQCAQRNQRHSQKGSWKRGAPRR